MRWVDIGSFDDTYTWSDTEEFDVITQSTEMYTERQSVTDLTSVIANAVNSIVGYTSITSDTTWTDVIPAGYMLNAIVVKETSGSSPKISIGTSAGGSQVFKSYTFTGSAITSIAVFKMFSDSATTTLYLNHASSGDTWNGASIDVYLNLIRIV